MTKEDPEDPDGGAAPDMWRHVIRPVSSDSAMQPATQIPAGTSKAMKQRLDQYLQEICSLMRDVDPDRIRERIVELAAVYHASVWDYENSSTIAERRKR